MLPAARLAACPAAGIVTIGGPVIGEAVVTAAGAGTSGAAGCGGATANGELTTGGATTVVPGVGAGWMTTGCGGTSRARSTSVKRLLIRERPAADDFGANVIQRIRIVLNRFGPLHRGRSGIREIRKPNVPLRFRRTAGACRRPSWRSTIKQQRLASESHHGHAGKPTCMRWVENAGRGL